ncbi:hypothetical protein H310_10756 [Aphanomyces invadans]|uniref:WRKY19-like zinc finger domain-containing protein n=1 Tax=Aphanomyces invadans TaxID=157072 RepID=A0A024TQ32_9STRA|nr:hypothetical protein H310_10752 [Aphanomyces invadans]XP_008875430.1 hypothetical protein H310_10756 [Aphanomyces invadans]ETV96115.1 hypothetical protein H310_10752 [Aphanomyces invadans]ETV96119.1 hypothetical protein H310_10756 [Aphanomyces invadans]|eukprot:XP_008875426.1 hypothetical protein H310_10752 [Aphanomyces invadans]
MVEASTWLDPGFPTTNDPWDAFHLEPASLLDKDCFAIDLDLSEVLLFDPIPYETSSPKLEPVDERLAPPVQPLAVPADAIAQVLPQEIPGQCLKHLCQNAIGYRGFCKDHGGARKCRIVGCPKGSQGRNLCIAHGGGKRCKVENCPKSAQSHGLCKGHGGGARCTFANCNKSSQGGGFCRKHGGGKRCDVAKCKNSAQRGNFCAKHGGSKACQAENCARTDRGGGYCELHRHYKILRLTKKLQDEMTSV